MARGQLVNGFREQINDPILTQLYDYWVSRRPDDKLPSRADIDPVDMPRAALPYVILAEIGGDDGRIRYRLVGTVMVREWGTDFTGKYLDEIMTGTYRKFIESLFQDVTELRCAVLSESTFRWDVGKIIGTRRLFMPLAKDGFTVDVVLIGQTFSRAEMSPDNPQKVIEILPGHTEVVRIHEMS